MSIKGLDFIPKKLFIRPEAFILNPAEALENIEIVDMKIEAILFDGANTKISAIIVESNDEVLISLPQNAQFEDLKEGDIIKVGIHQENLKCYKV